MIWGRHGAAGKIPLTSDACDATLRANSIHCCYMGELDGKRVQIPSRARHCKRGRKPTGLATG